MNTFRLKIVIKYSDGEREEKTLGSYPLVDGLTIPLQFKPKTVTEATVEILVP